MLLLDDFRSGKIGRITLELRREKRKSSRQYFCGREVKKGLIEVLFYIVLVFGVSFLLTTYVGQRTRVNGESMYPTLHDDDNLIVDKVSYRFSDPRRYDIIVFPYRYKDMYFIKRIIGLPGETVQIWTGMCT